METNKRRKIDEEGKENPSVDEIRTWVSGMSRDDALDFIAEQAARHPDLLAEVQDRIRADPTFTKMFVRSLSWETTDDTLRAAFEIFGPIQECVVIRDVATKRSKGFGFVTFETVEGAQAALKESTKVIDGREIHCHLASEKKERQQRQTRFNNAAVAAPPVQQQWVSSPPQRVVPLHPVDETKMFVHGLAWETTNDSLSRFMEQYGPLVECVVIFDKATGRSRGFGFVTFQSVDSVKLCLQEPQKMIDGRVVMCNLASERGGDGKGSNPNAIGHASVNGVGQTLDPLQQQLQQLQQQQLQLQQRLIQHQQQPLSTGIQMQQTPYAYQR